MKAILCILLISSVASCGKAQSDSTHAEIIPAPIAGVTCFAIVTGNGKIVGGNCLRN